MTPQEHAKKTTTLRSKITKTRNAAKQPITLAAKLELLAAVKKLEGDLHAHLLNFYELTGA